MGTGPALMMLAACAVAGSGELPQETEPASAPAIRTGAPDPGSAAPFAPDGSVEVRVLVPEVYELANVAIAITDHGRTAPYVVLREGAYHERVLEHFAPHSEHPLVRAIGPLIAASYRNYYGFRENAFSYRLEGARLVHEGRYESVWRHPDLFAEQLALVEDFAAASGFREFYDAERSTYDDQIARYRELVDLAGMAGWLHSRFPDQRIDVYTVVFSPLIQGSHSTGNFEVDGRREAVMFIAGPDLPVADADDAVRVGLHERIVFTEIDHNYVNPVTDRFRREVDRVFGDWRAWNTGDGYASPYLTFNEYMTWAVFTLYAADAYDDDTFREVVERSERLMEGRRGFVRFRAFDHELLRLYRETGAATVRELYPAILEWAGRRSGAL